MFWKKKKPCEHEWTIVKVGSGYYSEIYCPKCNCSMNVRKSEADSYVKKSKLRKEYLEKIKEESRDTT
ncbi:hypothetical protein M5X00_26040 [Paenibacillus alvei]|uniref:hypothetical protein n=1 Tax=Paenibacillus alvei TaxID=44250 RepID=UPI0021D0A7E3|nr:hypothetical protein [Paenibacillus alvei]MCY9545284.1 hypothetical protein [Paenibacillus alvei]MCY9707712.1 hypothetical protein [Paenibacillus alvei]MCY9757692.1 hypothetical protein [Paenibacillus alvei]MEC0082775.1 hypothetical protein [Paenibacillus alvei]